MTTASNGNANSRGGPMRRLRIDATAGGMSPASDAPPGRSGRHVVIVGVLLVLVTWGGALPGLPRLAGPLPCACPVRGQTRRDGDRPDGREGSRRRAPRSLARCGLRDPRDARDADRLEPARHGGAPVTPRRGDHTCRPGVSRVGPLRTGRPLGRHPRPRRPTPRPSPPPKALAAPQAGPLPLARGATQIPSPPGRGCPKGG